MAKLSIASYLTPGITPESGERKQSLFPGTVCRERPAWRCELLDGGWRQRQHRCGSQLYRAPRVSGAIGATNALGGTSALVSVDALQEFRVQTSVYAPEFGRSPGGQISIQTRSGTNQFHGTLFNYLRNGDLDATDWFADHNRLTKATRNPK